MNVLVIAPHPDDESIGCGATLHLYARRADRVVAVFLTSGEHGLRDLPREQAWQTREAEARTAAQVLGLSSVEFLRCRDYFLERHVDEASQRVEALLRREQPRVVFVPHPGETHPDHQAAHEIYRRAAARADFSPPNVHAYEVWTPLAECNHVVNVTAAMEVKLRAIRCYASQLQRFRYDHAIRGLNRYRGALLAQFRYAEAFKDLTNPASKMDIGLIPDTGNS